MRDRRPLVSAVVLGLFVSACGGGQTSDATPTTATPTTVATTGQTTTSISPATSSTVNGIAVAVVHDISYSETFTLNVYYPEESSEWPVAVVFHGGEVTKDSMSSYATQVAEGGIVVFVPEFRSTPEQLAEGIHVGFDDAACAMRFARQYASDYGGNAERIVTGGVSYGADVAAAMTLAGDQFGEGCLVGDEQSAMGDGVVGLDGLYDAVEAPELLGWHDLYSMEQLEKASATSYVEAPAREDVRFVLFTSSDSFAQDQAELFRSLLANVGYPVEILARPDVPHTAMFPTQAEGAVEALITMASG
jgi:hypothetical protein